MKIIIITIALTVLLVGCAIPRKYTTNTRPYTPAETGLLYGLVGAGIGAGLGTIMDTSIDEKWENYGASTYSGRWNNKSIKGSNGRKGGYSQRRGYQNVSRYRTKNRKGNNIINGVLQGFTMGERIGTQIGLEAQTRRLQEENARLRQQIYQSKI